jgi:hypothetical protein
MIYRLAGATWGALGLYAVASALSLCGSLVTKATANGNHHMRHAHAYGHIKRDYGVGWGWDSAYGYYQGPIFGKKGDTGYFHCFEPGYGWHSCPNYWIVPVRRHWW